MKRMKIGIREQVRIFGMISNRLVMISLDIRHVSSCRADIYLFISFYFMISRFWSAEVHSRRHRPGVSLVAQFGFHQSPPRDYILPTYAADMAEVYATRGVSDIQIYERDVSNAALCFVDDQAEETTNYRLLESSPSTSTNSWSSS
jgi:hypothetical protein